MTKKQRSRTKILLLFLASVIFYNEFLDYTLQTWFKWPSIHCNDSSKCLKILLVADPQILGERFELGFPIGSLTRWDCDRYLLKTFQKAVSHVGPDVIVFLGDLMDEGSVATNEEYTRYLHRFSNIFYAGPDIKFVFVPGDNDIGGEGNDRLTNDKLSRFELSFHQPDTFKIRNVDLFKVNRLTNNIPLIQDNITHFLENRTHIVVTHLPLLFLPNQFIQKVIKQLRPQVIFSAHDHKSLRMSSDSVLTMDKQVMEMLSPGGGPLWHFQLSSKLTHEVMVPTCSYRMGVYNMGYGVALIDGNGESMTYGVLWLPSRFIHLGIYLGMLIVIFIYWMSVMFCQVYSKMKLRHMYSKFRHTARV